MGKCMTKDEYVFRSSTGSKSCADTNKENSISNIPKSEFLLAASAPSDIETEDITSIYKVPNEKFNTTEEVLNEHGLELLKKIDEGGFAKVFLARNTFKNLQLACKVIDIGNDDEKIKLVDVKNELFVLVKIKHPHIVKMYNHFIINNNLFIFMDFADSGNMFRFMYLHGSLPEIIAKKPFSQIVSGVSYMHAMNIAHRDLKASNILLDSDSEGNLRILITDFGLSRVVYRRSKGMLLCKSYCGTPTYMAPELKRRNRYNAFMIDIYALGVLLFYMLHAEYPFSANDEDKALKEALKLDIYWSDQIKLSLECKKLIRSMLEPTPQSRLIMHDLVTAPWFNEEMKENQLPDLEKLPKSMYVGRRLSSPGDDIRLSSMQKRTSSKSRQKLTTSKSNIIERRKTISSRSLQTHKSSDILKAVKSRESNANMTSGTLQKKQYSGNTMTKLNYKRNVK